MLVAASSWDTSLSVTALRVDVENYAKLLAMASRRITKTITAMSSSSSGHA